MLARRGAADLQPQLAGPHNGLGRTNLELRKYDEAIANFTTALQLEPSSTACSACFLEGRALAYEAVGDAAKAKADREAAAQLR
jgi:tetratricopeptide (TPR) repeat protein